MLDRDRRAVRLCLLLPLVLATACAKSTAPPGWLPEPSEAPPDLYGGWVVVWSSEAGRRQAAQGELIAVEEDTVFVLSARGLIAIPRAHITAATLTAYFPDTRRISGWGILGTLSTLSHGIGLILSAPVWIIGSTAAASSVSREPRLEYPQQPWEVLRMYARFPQGLPEGIERSPLRPKGRR
jgi:hypothetical protein